MRSLFLAATVLAVFAPSAATAAPGQPLAIFVHGAAARTRLLPTYDNVLPIAVRVAGDARHFDAVTITANGPDGHSVTTPLVKGTRGFVGRLRLGAPGTWSLALTTRVGSVTSAITAVPIAVATPLVAEPLASALMALAVALCLAGVTLVVARPRLRRRIQET
jgi:hypothetical protein